MKHLITVCLLAVYLVAGGQNDCRYSITGIVTDEHNSEALAFASIRIDGEERGVSADESGRFELTGLCHGRIKLVVSHVGCDPVEVALMLSSDTSITILLEHHVDLLKAVEIETARPHLDISARTNVGIEPMEGNPGRDLAGLLDEVAGVQSLQSGGNIAKPMIHGLSGNRVVIVNDNVSLEGQQWGSEHAPEVDPMAVEEIEVVYGASSLRYGPDAVAGAIITSTGDITADSSLNGWLHLLAASNGRRGGTASKIQGSLVPGSPLFFMLQGTYQQAGDMQAPGYMLNNTGKAERNFRGRLEYAGATFGASTGYAQFNTDLGILSYAHIGNLSDLERAIEADRPPGATDDFSYSIGRPYQHVEHEIASAALWWKPRIETKISLDYARQYNLREEFDTKSFGDDDPQLHYELTTHQASLHLDHRWTAQQKSEFGVLFQSQSNTYEGRFFIPNYSSVETGFYGVHHLQLNTVEFEAGLRYDHRRQQAFMYRDDTLYHPLLSFSGLSWNAGFQKEGEWFTLSSNIAHGWRYPAVNELYSDGLHHGAASVEIGDEELREERAYSWFNQLDMDDLEMLGFSVSGMVRLHATYYRDFIYLTPSGEPVLTIRGAFPSFQYNAVDAVFRGIDFNMAWNRKDRLIISVKGELVRANDATSGMPLIYIPSDRFDGGLRLNLKSDGGPYIAAYMTYVNRQRRFPDGLDYAAPPNAYFLMHAEFGWRFIMTRYNAMYLVLRVENIGDVAYRSYMNRLRYFADEPGRNVMLTLRIPFDVKP